VLNLSMSSTPSGVGDRAPRLSASLNDFWPNLISAGPRPTAHHRSPAQADLQRLAAASAPDRSAPLTETTQTLCRPARHTMEAFLSIRTHFAAAPPGCARPDFPGRTSRSTASAPPHGHGHNYLLDVTVRARSNPRYRALSRDLAVLQQLREQSVVEPLRSHLPQHRIVPIRRLRAHRRKTRPAHRRPATHRLPPRRPAAIKCACRRAPNNAAESFAEVPF